MSAYLPACQPARPTLCPHTIYHAHVFLFGVALYCCDKSSWTRNEAGGQPYSHGVQQVIAVSCTGSMWLHVCYSCGAGPGGRGHMVTRNASPQLQGLCEHYLGAREAEVASRLAIHERSRKGTVHWNITIVCLLLHYGINM